MASPYGSGCRGAWSTVGGNRGNGRKGGAERGRGNNGGYKHGGQSVYPTDFSDWSESGEPELHAEQTKKRQRSNTGGEANQVSLNEFQCLNIDDKLSRMMSILLPLEGIEKSLVVLGGEVKEARAEVKQLRSTVCGIEDRLKLVEYRSIDLEARSRRNNLLFYGLTETVDENCKDLARDVIVQKLGIACGSTMYIHRAHRLGKVKVGTAVRPRPIIVAFRDYGDVDMVMAEVKKLKGSGLGINRDYPHDIHKARVRLSKQFNEAKAAGGNPKILFPARLIVDDKIVRDEFPDWGKSLSGRRESTGGSRVRAVSFDADIVGEAEPGSPMRSGTTRAEPGSPANRCRVEAELASPARASGEPVKGDSDSMSA